MRWRFFVKLLGKGFCSDSVPVGHEKCSFEDIFKLSNISLPDCVFENLLGFHCELLFSFTGSRGKPFQNTFCDEDDVIRTFPQRRNVDVKDVQPVE